MNVTQNLANFTKLSSSPQIHHRIREHKQKQLLQKPCYLPTHSHKTSPLPILISYRRHIHLSHSSKPKPLPYRVIGKKITRPFATLRQLRVSNPAEVQQ